MPACGIARNSDAVRLDAESRRIRARPADRCLDVFNLRWPPRGAVGGQAVLRGDVGVAAGAQRLQPPRQAILVSAREATAVEMNHRHSLAGRARRLVDIEVQVGVAALPVDDVLFNVRGRGGRALCLRGTCAQLGEGQRRPEASKKEPPCQVVGWHRSSPQMKNPGCILSHQHDSP